MAFYINTQIKKLDYSHFLNLEQKIILGDQASSVVDTLDMKMSKQADKNKVLRLMCLLSITEGGIKEKFFNLLKRSYILVRDIFYK